MIQLLHMVLYNNNIKDRRKISPTLSFCEIADVSSCSSSFSTVVGAAGSGSEDIKASASVTEAAATNPSVSGV